jgi:hypothetical protein
MILKTSPNGNLRLRKMKNGNGVVELLSWGEWKWCVWRSSPMDRAMNTFDNQVKFHQV